jgi:hypothetical protein
VSPLARHALVDFRYGNSWTYELASLLAIESSMGATETFTPNFYQHSPWPAWHIGRGHLPQPADLAHRLRALSCMGQLPLRRVGGLGVWLVRGLDAEVG